MESNVELTTENGHFKMVFSLKQGEQGAPFTIKGKAYSTLEELRDGVPNPEIGDMYNVGTAAPYNIYRWNGEDWEDQGSIGIDVQSMTNDEINAICV